jgi:hypothetical protein
MTDDDEKESPALARMRRTLAEVLSAWPDRPHDALLLLKESYAEYQSMGCRGTQVARRDVPSYGYEEGRLAGSAGL